MEKEEQILSLDFSQISKHLVYGGKNCQIAVFDQENLQLIKKFERGDSYCHGHTNRIFKVKCIHDQPNLILSGGWDCTVFAWDIRQTKPAASFFGPCISGDSIDYKNNVILTGSYREKCALELWDIRNYKKLCEINTKTRSGNQVNYVSTCQFSQGRNDSKGYIIAGSSMSNVVALYSKDLVYDLDLEIQGIPGSIYSSGFSKEDSKFYFGTNEGKFFVYSYFSMNGV